MGLWRHDYLGVVGPGPCGLPRLFLWAVGSVQQGKLNFIWTPLYIPTALFLLLGLGQYAARLPLDRSETRQALVLLATDLVFFFLAVQLFAGAARRTWRAFGLVVLVFAGLLGLFAILQFAAGEQQIYGSFETPGNLVFGPYVNPNHFAGLLEMLLPVAVLYLAEVRARRGKRGKGEMGKWEEGRFVTRRSSPAVGVLVLLASAATVAAASLLLTGSRGGLIALSTEVAIAGVLLRRRAPTRGLVTAAAAAVAAAMLLFYWVDPGWASKRLARFVDLPSPTAVDSGRGAWALDALRMWRTHPLLGVGLGNFETAYPGYQSVPSDIWLDHVHNDYLEALAETGLAGAVLIASAVALFFALP